MAVLDSCLPFLYAIAEKGRKDEERTDQEQARAHKRYDGLGNTVLARVHLYVNLESGHNHTNPGDGTTESLDVEHHRYHVVAVSYTHLRAHETRHDLVCRLLLEKKKKTTKKKINEK